MLRCLPHSGNFTLAKSKKIVIFGPFLFFSISLSTLNVFFCTFVPFYSPCVKILRRHKLIPPALRRSARYPWSDSGGLGRGRRLPPQRHPRRSLRAGRPLRDSRQPRSDPLNKNTLILSPSWNLIKIYHPIGIFSFNNAPVCPRIAFQSTIFKLKCFSIRDF